MRYFIREDEKPSQIDESTNKPYLQYALIHYKEITKEEYDALCPKEEPIQNVTIPENKPVESPVKETVEPVRYF